MRARALAVVVAALAPWACGGGRAAPAAAVPASAAASAPEVPPPTASPPPPLPDHTLARSAVRAAVARGLGAFLQRLELDDQPVFAGGKFHGFRIAALRGADFWAGVDLRPGDVVTGVNGMPIERPEQAQAVFDSLQVASELRVAYEREGHARELVFAIIDGR
jgi:type II secretory pathway component PulC